MGVKTEANKGLNEGFYTPIQTLAEIGLGFLGKKTPKQLPLIKYENVAKENNRIENNSFPTETETTSRYLNPLYQNLPLILGGQPPSQEPEFIEITSKVKTKGEFKNRLLNLRYGNRESNIISSYGGGPNSLGGLGRTIISFHKTEDFAIDEKNRNLLDPQNEFKINFKDDYNHNKDTKVNPLKYPQTPTSLLFDKFVKPSKTLEKIFKDQNETNYIFNVYDPLIEGNTFPDNTPQSKVNKTLTLNQQELYERKKDNEIQNHEILTSFNNSLLKEKTSTIMSLTPNYTNKNIELRVNLGDPAKHTLSNKPRNLHDYSSSDLKPLDTINSSLPYIDTLKSKEYNDLLGAKKGKELERKYSNIKIYKDRYKYKSNNK
jgi:hypothetical protein